MKLALATWNGRISPVFDVSKRVLVMEVAAGKMISRQEHDFATDEPSAKVARLTEFGIDTLVCGAVSRPLADLIVSRGIRLIPFVAGETDEVAQACLAGTLPNPALAMPGCCGRRGRFGGRGGGRSMGAYFDRRPIM